MLFGRNNPQYKPTLQPIVVLHSAASTPIQTCSEFWLRQLSVASAKASNTHVFLPVEEGWSTQLPMRHMSCNSPGRSEILVAIWVGPFTRGASSSVSTPSRGIWHGQWQHFAFHMIYTQQVITLRARGEPTCAHALQLDWGQLQRCLAYRERLHTDVGWANKLWRGNMAQLNVGWRNTCVIIVFPAAGSDCDPMPCSRDCIPSLANTLQMDLRSRVQIWTCMIH